MQVRTIHRAIVGLGTAASAAARDMEKNIEKETKLRDHLIERVLAEIPYSRLNGDRTKRLPGNANFCFRFIEGESPSDSVRPAGHLRIVRFCLHIRLSGPSHVLPLLSDCLCMRSHTAPETDSFGRDNTGRH